MTSSTQSSTAVSVRDVSVAFDGVLALNGVSFDAHEGEILGIIGPNGAGKSTLINCISGLQRHKGHIEVLGNAVSGRPAHAIARLGIGRTFQAPQVMLRTSVIANVKLGQHRSMKATALGNLVGSPRSYRDERSVSRRASEALQFLDLERLANVRASDLAHGDLKVLEIARVICMDPKVMLLDEPTSGLTLDARGRVADILRRVRSEVGATQIVIEHDVSFMRNLCDRLVVLNFGEILAEGPPDDVLNDERVRLGYLGQQRNPARRSANRLQVLQTRPVRTDDD